MLIRLAPISRAGASQRSPVEDASSKSIDSLFELNVGGTMRLTRAVLPLLMAQSKSKGGCRIVVVGSMAGQVREEGFRFGKEPPKPLLIDYQLDAEINLWALSRLNRNVMKIDTCASPCSLQLL